MAGRPGARRRPKKGPTVGTGGYGRRALEGRGPTPKAEDRVYHAAYRAKKAAIARAPKPVRRKPLSAAEYVGGRNSALEALRAGVRPTTLYVASRIDADDRVREILALVTKAGLPVLEVGKAELDRFMAGGVHQGVVLQVAPYEYAHPDDLVTDAAGTPLLVALDGVTDPRNLGAVLRSAAAFGADGVIVPQRRAAGVTAAAWKTSAGAAARVPVARVTNLARALAAYKQQGLFVVGLDAGGSTPMAQLELATSPLVLVVGSEGKGLSRLVASTCDLIAAIPITGDMESLNASVAAGIALYQISQARG